MQAGDYSSAEPGKQSMEDGPLILQDCWIGRGHLP